MLELVGAFELSLDRELHFGKKLCAILGLIGVGLQPFPKSLIIDAEIPGRGLELPCFRNGAKKFVGSLRVLGQLLQIVIDSTQFLPVLVKCQDRKSTRLNSS